MKRLITSAIFTLTIILLYQLIDINLFTIDLPRRVRCEVFKDLRYDPEFDPSILIVDIEYMELEKVKERLQVLESLGPKAIGVNLCNIAETNEVLNNYLDQNKKIITCDCKSQSNKGTSRITSDNNEVTHFLADKDSYFELQLADKSRTLRERGNNKERINFRAKNMYYQLPLSELDSIAPDVVHNQIVLVGFLRDSLITPLNHWYGRYSVNEGDMSDAQISANIISTINRNEFIDEFNPFFRVMIILFISLSNTVLLRLFQTRRDIVNLLLGVTCFVVVNGLSSFIIIFAFAHNHYLDLDEMTAVLFVSSIVSIYWNTRCNKAPAHNTSYRSVPGEG